MTDLLGELTWRGMLHQCTNLDGLREHLGEPRKVYAGFDPTSDSLTIGNLVPIMLLSQFQSAGHTPVVVMGGGTGLVGDPSGKEAERQLRTREQVLENVRSQRRIFERILDFDGANAAVIVNNLDWLSELKFVDVLRDVGKHFSVNMMIQKDSVRRRLEDRSQGISYTEFSYMILQAYDFQWLYDHEQVTIELGGSDQWGNVVAGVDLIRRVCQSEVFGLTAPLLSKADGGKFGKTESGAVWLSAERTSAYAFYQFWMNAADADVGQFLRWFTTLSKNEIERLEEEHFGDAGKRLAQRTLASHVTRRVHGDEATARAEHASQALFSGDVESLSEELLREVFANVPSSAHEKSTLGESGMAMLDLLLEAGVAKSKREGRQYLDSGAISVNGRRVDQAFRLTEKQLLHGSTACIRRGRKTWHVTRWS